MEIELRIATDGITVNQSLDLLNVEGASDSQKAHIKGALNTYRRALENLVNVVLLSDVMVFDAKIVRGSTVRDAAGAFIQELANALRTTDSDPVLIDHVPDPEDLLSRNEEMKDIDQVLPAYNKVIGGPNQYLWRDYIQREFLNYFGSDPTLTKSGPPNNYRFCDGKRDYFVNEKTEPLIRNHLDNVPPSAVQWLVQQCAKVRSSPVHPDAVEEFCRRVAFAHVLIGENATLYLDTTARKVNGTADCGWKSDKLLHSVSDVSLCPTRQDLRRVLNLKPDRIYDTQEARFMTALMPYLFERVLANLPGSKLPSTSVFVHALASVRDQTEVRTVRDFFKKLRARGTSSAAAELANYTAVLTESQFVSAGVNVEVSSPEWTGMPAKAKFLLAEGLLYVQKIIPGRRAHWAVKRLQSQGSIAEVDHRISSRFKQMFPTTF